MRGTSCSVTYLRAGTRGGEGRTGQSGRLSILEHVMPTGQREGCSMAGMTTQPRAQRSPAQLSAAQRGAHPAFSMAYSFSLVSSFVSMAMSDTWHVSQHSRVGVAMRLGHQAYRTSTGSHRASPATPASAPAGPLSTGGARCACRAPQTCSCNTPGAQPRERNDHPSVGCILGCMVG